MINRVDLNSKVIFPDFSIVGYVEPEPAQSSHHLVVVCNFFPIKPDISLVIYGIEIQPNTLTPTGFRKAEFFAILIRVLPWIPFIRQMTVLSQIMLFIEFIGRIRYKEVV